MSWKDVPKYIYDITKFAYSIPKDSYKIEVDKFHIPPSSHPLTIPYQGPKVRYSEGDEINTVEDFRFDLDFTRIPLGPDHFPCGYWHKNYIPPFTIIYTSLLYPLEVVEAIIGSVGIESGTFRLVMHNVEFEDYISETVTLDSGSFRSLLTGVDFSDSISDALSIESGVFKDVLLSYTMEVHSINCDIDIDSGTFRDALITYTFWPYESINCNVGMVGGTHASS